MDTDIYRCRYFPPNLSNTWADIVLMEDDKAPGRTCIVATVEKSPQGRKVVETAIEGSTHATMHGVDEVEWKPCEELDVPLPIVMTAAKSDYAPRANARQWYQGKVPRHFLPRLRELQAMLPQAIRNRPSVAYMVATAILAIVLGAWLVHFYGSVQVVPLSQ